MDWLLHHPHLFYSRLSLYHSVHKAWRFAIRGACLLLALSLLTACDSKEDIAAQQVKDKASVHKLLSETYRALCGRYPGSLPEQYIARKKMLSSYFQNELVEPAMKFVSESSPRCYFPDVVENSIYIDGSNAEAVVYSSKNRAYAVPVELKRRWLDGHWQISAINFELVQQYLKTSQPSPLLTAQIQEIQERAQVQESEYPAQSVEQEQPEPLWDTVVRWIFNVLKALAILVAILAAAYVFYAWRYVMMGGHRKFEAQCKKAPVSSELWPLAVGAPYAIVTDYDWNTIAADNEEQAAENKQKAKEGLSSSWGIDDRESLLAELFELFTSGHRAVYAEQIESDCNMPEHEYVEYASRLALASKHNSDCKERLWQLNAARKNKRRICQLDFLAWDMVRFVMLCHDGAKAGFLSEQEMLDFSLLAAVELQPHYQSWRDLGQAFLLARWYWKATDKFHLLTHCLFKKAISTLLKQQGSPWRTLEWNCSLATPISFEQFAMTCNPAETYEWMDEDQDDKLVDESVY